MNKEHTALVLIDMQQETNYNLPQLKDILKKTRELATVCREQGIPVIYTRQVNRADGIGLSSMEPITNEGRPFYYDASSSSIDIFPEIAPHEEDVVVDKYRWSAFYETPLDLFLRNQGITDLIMAGFVTDGCLMTSTYDAYFRDYTMHMVHDLTATTSEGAHMSAHLTMGSWIYNMTYYTAMGMMKKLNGADYQSFKPEQPDSLPFTPETLRETFENTILKHT
ncbi:cysteine hydrolase family protein [Salsuginibacillus kocurii]|uniref:cysteine hydrolase family protein n=1 Tax=Salsuginibacillus kocurii TaxID=427078 RepID=UPI00036F2AA2|nr:isochorismatase family cysteine hydrolase [Salsuginibacillus kocurii]